MQEVCDFLKQADTFFLATTEDNQPRVRPFASVMLFGGRLYLFTSSQKPVFGQILQNPLVEICAIGPYKDTWLRLQATAVPDDNREVRVRFLEEEPFLKPLYNPDDGLMQVFYLKDATANFYSYSEGTNTVKASAPAKVIRF